jgi:hypothetical protein
MQEVGACLQNDAAGMQSKDEMLPGYGTLVPIFTSSKYIYQLSYLISHQTRPDVRNPRNNSGTQTISYVRSSR